MNFTKWLAKEDNISILLDEIGVSGENIVTEDSAGRFNCDITADEVESGKKIIIENNAAIETDKLVIISEFLSPINFPKKPEMTEASNGKNKIIYSILPFKFIYFLNSYCSSVSVINYYNC